MAPPQPAPVQPAAAPEPASGGDAEKTLYVEIPDDTSKALIGVLACIDGPLKGEIYSVREGESTIGRSVQCAVKLSDKDKMVSREHAKIICIDDTLGIQPLSEKNPVFLNGEMVEEADQLSSPVIESLMPPWPNPRPRIRGHDGKGNRSLKVGNHGIR